MTAHVCTVVRCEAKGCTAIISGDPGPQHSRGVDPDSVRMVAQQAGWAVRRKHRGADLCPEHRGAG